MTIKEVMEMYEGKFADVEFFVPATVNADPKNFHTDIVTHIDESEADESATVLTYDLADEEDYNRSVFANTGETADFAEWFDDKNAKVLLVCVNPDCKNESK